MAVVKVAVAGYFDPFHEGHLALIRNAKKLGDYLIVMMNSIEQCERKHKYHFHTKEGKIAILKAVGADEVVEVQDDTDKDGSVAETLSRIKPDIYGVGEGYDVNNLPLKEIIVCRETGCKIVFNLAPRLNRSSNFWKQNERTG